MIEIILFLYTDNGKSKNEIKKTIAFIIASPNIKYFGMSLTKYIHWILDSISWLHRFIPLTKSI